VVYRVVPKCACSTIGQIMYYSDTARSSTATSTTPRTGLHKWALEASQPLIEANVQGAQILRLHLRAQSLHPHPVVFFDKICGIQRNGKRYRGNLVPLLIQKYGIEVGGDRRHRGVRPDQELPALPAVRARHDPLAPPDGPRHPLVGHVGPCLDLHREWRALRPHLLDRANSTTACRPCSTISRRRTPSILTNVPRFNESEGHGPKRAHPVEDYFDDLSMHLVYEIYKRDFELFKYDFDDPAASATRCRIGRDRPRRGARQAGNPQTPPRGWNWPRPISPWATTPWRSFT
jgi:hypothetical protein